MRCDEVRNRLADYLRGELSLPAAAELRQHVDSCTACGEDIRGIQTFWVRLGKLPAEPIPPASRARFDDMLDAYCAESEEARPSGIRSDGPQHVRRSWRWSPVVQASAAAALLAVGMLV